MNRTKIEWVKNPDGTQGYTWNPITGCLNHTPEGLCLGGMFPCYAYKLAHGRLKPLYLANKNCAPVLEPPMHYIPSPKNQNDPFYPRFWEDRLDDPFLTDRNICIKRHTRGQRRTPKGIFVCDMGELFGDWLPREWQEAIHLTITLNPQHRFYLLTKQPQNLIKWSPFPDNCWVGVTATEPPMMREAFKQLKSIESRVKYISFEPLHGMIFGGDHNTIEVFIKDSGISWVIIGCQTKPLKVPKFEWVTEVIDACKQAGIPVFLKPPLAKIMGMNLQEMP